MELKPGDLVLDNEGDLALIAERDEEALKIAKALVERYG